jgi:hypothetical protein
VTDDAADVDDGERAKRAHELITALRNDGYEVAYSDRANDEFPEHVAAGREALADPAELMGYFLVAMAEGQTDYHASTVVDDGTASFVAQIQMLGAHFRALYDSTGEEMGVDMLVNSMIDEALTIDEIEDSL